MRINYSEDGEDWSPHATYDYDKERLVKPLLPYIFQGEYEIFNQFDGYLVEFAKQFDWNIYYVFNGIWDLDGPEPKIQINCGNKDDEVVFRLEFIF